VAYSVISEASGDRVFVIGDIHGCPKEPEILLKHLEEKEGVTQSDLVVFLGDYIDRGPDSKSVIDIVLDFKKRFPNTRFLKGNHEDMMLDFLGFGGNLGQAFLYNGGLETIQSYGISVFAPSTEMVEALPPDHFKFFCELESMLLLDKFVCVHAGLNPLRDLEKQQDDEAFWIRDEFLNNIHSFKKMVVFGHTPHQEIFEHLPYKLGIDTGLVFGNKLTCVELNSGQVWQVRRDSLEVQVSQADLSSIALLS
jgi:serine/threonine protein phosphatase 1